MRIRTIKPEFWSNELIAQLDDFTQLLAIGLLNYADDDGYFNANSKLIQASVFPLRDVSGTVTVSVTHLSKQGYLKLYKSEDGRTYGRIVNFSKHQVINKPKPSRIKPLCTQDHEISKIPVRVPDEYLEEQGTGNRELELGKDLERPAKPVRERDPLFDALAAVSGADPKELTGRAARACGVALAEIRKATPTVTPEEIAARALNYRTHFRDASLTPSAIASHWATCAKPSDRTGSSQQKPDRINFKTDDYANLRT